MEHPRGLGPDLEDALSRADEEMRRLSGQHVVMTGGTGFVGSWMVELFTWALDRHGNDARLTILTRSPERFGATHPHLAAHRSVVLVRGDVRDGALSVSAPDLLVAGAAASVAAGDAPDEAAMRATADAGAALARRLMTEHACRCLYLSSGAAARTRPDAYGAAKLSAERLLVDDRGGVPAAVVARLFAFVGPYLPLGLNFAVGNFLADALAGRTVRARGDGRAVRSYLYGADLARYLWVLALAGEAGARYDVGGDEPVSIAELAGAVARLVAPPLDVILEGAETTSSASDRYLPDLGPTSALGLRPAWTLEAALRRTFEWQRAVGA